MWMHELQAWRFQTKDAGRERFDALLAEGKALDVTRRAPGWFCGRPAAVESRTFDRFVA
jgi:hypothetical protein